MYNHHTSRLKRPPTIPVADMELRRPHRCREAGYRDTKGMSRISTREQRYSPRTTMTTSPTTCTTHQSHELGTSRVAEQTNRCSR